MCACAKHVTVMKLCVKKITIYLLAVAMLFHFPAHCEDLDEAQAVYDQALGICATDGMTTGVGVSMMGWGLAIIIGITILAIVIHQSAAGTTHQQSAPGGTQSPNSGIGSVI